MALALTSELLMPTLAPTPTFGLTLDVPEAEPLRVGELEAAVDDVWPDEAPCVMFEVEPMSVDCWFALTPLVTV